MITRCLLTLGFSMVISSQASAKSLAVETVLVRSQPWQLNYDLNVCRLTGTFGPQKDVLMRMTKARRGPGFVLELIGERFSDKWPRSFGKLDFGVRDGPADVVFQVGKISGKTALITGASFSIGPIKYQPNWSRERAAKEWEAAKLIPVDPAQVHSLRIQLSPKNTLQLEFGSMGKAMQQLDMCLDDLVRSWGYDPNKINSLRSDVEPLTFPGDWGKSSDYPKKELKDGERALVRFRIDVDESGSPKRCNIIEAPSNPVFSTKTCALAMERARFKPAIDAEGKPTAGFWTSSVIFN